MMYSACSPRNKVFLGHGRLRTLVYKPYHDLKKGIHHILLDQTGRGKGIPIFLFSPINLSTHSMDVNEIRLSLRAKFWFHLLLQSVIQIWWMLCGPNQPTTLNFCGFKMPGIFSSQSLESVLIFFFFLIWDLPEGRICLFFVKNTIQTTASS